MYTLYPDLDENSMKIFTCKRAAEANKGIDEVVVPVSDTTKTAGWRVMSLSDYIRDRYCGNQRIEGRPHACLSQSVLCYSVPCLPLAASHMGSKKPQKRSVYQTA